MDTTGAAGGHYRCCRWTLQALLGTLKALHTDTTGAVDGHYRSYRWTLQVL
jgi:hypothetical protein